MTLWVSEQRSRKSPNHGNMVVAISKESFLPPGFLLQKTNKLVFCLSYYSRIFCWILSLIDNRFSSVAQSCPTFCDPMDCSTPGLPVHHKLPEFTKTHAHRVSDAIKPAHPLSSTSPPAPNPSKHQGLFQWVNSSHEVAKLLEFQLQHQSFQWTPRTVQKHQFFGTQLSL